MSGSFGRGLDFLKEQQAAASEMRGASGDGTPRMWKFWVRSEESAKFFWVTEHTDLLFPLVHGVMRKSKAPGAKPWSKDILCGRYNLSEDYEVCKECVKRAEQLAKGGEIADVDKIRGPWTRAVALVYVTTITHQTADKDNKWRPIKVKGSDKIWYIEDVNDYRLFPMKDKVVNQISEFLAGDPEEGEAPTSILDREWRLSRTGQGPDTVEKITAGKEGVPEVVVAARNNAPSLEKLIISEYGVAPRIKPESSHVVRETGEAVEFAAEDEGFDALASEDGDVSFE